MGTGINGNDSHAQEHIACVGVYAFGSTGHHAVPIRAISVLVRRQPAPAHFLEKELERIAQAQCHQSI